MHLAGQVADQGGIDIGRSFAAIGVEVIGAAIGRQGDRRINIGRTDKVIGLLGRQIGAVAAPTDTHTQPVLHTQRRHLALHRCIPGPGAALLAFAAVVVDVEITIGTQARIHIVGRTAATIRKGQTVLYDRALRAQAQMGLPIGVDLVVHGQLDVGAGGLKRQRPGLVVQIQTCIVGRRQGIGHAISIGVEQAQARNGWLFLVVVFQIQCNLGAGSDGIGQRQTGELALSIGSIKWCAQILSCQIGAHTGGTPTRIAVEMHLAAAIAVSTNGYGGERVGLRRLGHKIHQPTGRRHTGLQAGHTFQDLDALLVFQRDGRIVGYWQAIAQEVVARIQHKAAHRQTFHIAGGVVAVGQRGIQFDGLRQAAGRGCGQQIGTQHRNALRRLRQGAAQAANVRVVHIQYRRRFANDCDLRQALRLGLCPHRGGKQQRQSRGARCQ